MALLHILLAAVIWIGHACLWTTLLNMLYSRPLPKHFLKPWRLFTGVVLAAFAAWLVYATAQDFDEIPPVLQVYSAFCLVVGGLFFPIITLARNLRPKPKSLLSERTVTLDLGKALGPVVVGDGKWRWLTRLPGNGVFRVDVTELSLALPRMPLALDGLSILLLSDVHFHGTPSKRWFDAIIDHLLTLPKPDIVVLAGDYVDTDTHREWIAPILGRLQWNEVGVAILGNHDAYHGPARIRAELKKAGYAVLGAATKEAIIRNERCEIVGNEAPWFPAPKMPRLGGFRICVSHSPDQFRWAQARAADLILCGHVHGGQIRLPIIGSIFVPSWFGRRYDMGVFEDRGTVMVVGRGLSGKEPLRFRCNPQVIRMVLRCLRKPSTTTEMASGTA